MAIHDISEIGNPDAWEELDISEELEKEQVAYEKAHKDTIKISIVPEDSPPVHSDTCSCGQRIGDYGCPYCGE